MRLGLVPRTTLMSLSILGGSFLFAAPAELAFAASTPGAPTNVVVEHESGHCEGRVDPTPQRWRRGHIRLRRDALQGRRRPAGSAFSIRRSCSAESRA